jgi:hypothetical protein
LTIRSAIARSRQMPTKAPSAVSTA